VNKLAFVENDFAIINADHVPQLVVQELLPAVFDNFRESDPVVDREHDLIPLKHAKIARLVKRQPLLDVSTPSFPTMTPPSSRRRTSHCSPLLKRFSLTPFQTAPLAIL
jgi:hypothetical protein